MRRIAAVLVLLLAGCGGPAGGSDDEQLKVLAASSLTGVFESLAGSFEDSHPGVRVSLVLDSSATLATQVREGAPADVLATADLATMKTVLDSGDAEESRVFATNRMVMVTPADNPAGIRSFADLSHPGVAFVACVPTAPCGSIADRLLTDNDVTARPKSLEVDVKAVLTKVTSDEADAGLVYATDARAAGDDVRVFPVPGADRVPNDYAIAVVDQTRHRGLAQDWVDLVRSDEGQKVLRDAGFGPPR